MRNAVMPLAAFLAALSVLGGCHASSDQNPSPSPSPIIQGSKVVPPHGFVPVAITTTAGGTLTLRLGLTPSIVVAGIVTSACATGARSGCSPLSYTEAATNDSSKTLTAAGAAAGSYVLIFGNVGAASQSVSYTVTLTTS